MSGGIETVEAKQKRTTLRRVPKDHTHNNWEIVRIRKNRLTTLRCRECQVQVKNTDFPKCAAFHAEQGCDDPDCVLLHIHQHKESLKQRVEKHGVTVLEKVPESVRSSFLSTRSESSSSSEESVEVHPFVIMQDDGTFEVCWVGGSPPPSPPSPTYLRSLTEP